MTSKPQWIGCSFVAPRIEILERRQLLSGLTKFEVIAQTGQDSGGAGALLNISPQVSINDAGQVAFAGDYESSQGSTSGVFAGINAGHLTKVTPDSVLTSEYASPGIDNSGHVVTAEVIAGALGPAYAIREWSISSPGQFQNVDVEQTGDSVFNPAISKGSNLVSYLYHPAGSGFSSLELEGSPRGLIVGSGQAQVEPTVADNGNIAARSLRPTDPLKLYTAHGSIVIADPSDFNSLGYAPGISSDGTVIAFYGDLTEAGAAHLNESRPTWVDQLQPGPGIFVSIEVGGVWIIQRVAGVSGNGSLDPGEQGDTNGNGVIDGGERDVGPFTAFDSTSRIGVAVDQGVLKLAFVATGTDMKTGIYTSETQIHPLQPLDPEHTLIVEQGDSIPGVSISPQHFALFNPINTSDRIVFWVSDASDTGSAVVTAQLRTALAFREINLVNRDQSWADTLKGLITNNGTVGGDGIPGWDHVGLVNNEQVYEAHPGYTEGTSYWDPEQNDYVSINPNTSGVQAQHTPGSFEWDSPSTGTGGVSPTVSSVEEIPIRPELADAMQAEIQTQLGKPFLLASTSQSVLDAILPANQKGASGAFTCVGLIEWAAEQVAKQHPEWLPAGSQGFIPDEWESITFAGRTFPTLSPALLHYVVSHPGVPLSNLRLLQAVFDPTDFIITDPLGRRLGHTASFGDLNEIPGAYYTGHGAFDQVFIGDPLPGPYQVQLFGNGTAVTAAMGDGVNASAFDGTLSQGQTQSFTVTEPGILGDLNHDGAVNFSDLLILAQNYGRLRTSMDAGDINGDGSVNFPDLLLLAQNYGHIPNPPAAASVAAADYTNLPTTADLASKNAKTRFGRRPKWANAPISATGGFHAQR